MLLNVILGCTMLAITTVLHATATMYVMGRLPDPEVLRLESKWSRAWLLVRTVLTMFLVAVVEAALWAVLYLLLGALTRFEESMYFSMVSFTTLGYGDVTLLDRWRLLASFQAANGTMMFGWTTAVIVAILQQMARRPGGLHSNLGSRTVDADPGAADDVSAAS